MPILSLTVDSAYLEDYGDGKVRLDPDTMLALNVSPGDLIAIEGSHTTIATVWRLKKDDWKKRKIRIDNFTQTNAGAFNGDKVQISKIFKSIEANRVLLSLPKELLQQILATHEEKIVNRLINFPALMNDLIPISFGPSFEDGRIIAIKIVEMEPKIANIITKNTEIQLSDQPLPNSDDKSASSHQDVIAWWFNQGAAHAYQGQYWEAIFAYDRALDLNPNHVEAWFGKGSSLGDLGMEKEAIVAYDRALAIKPDFSDVWFNKGVSLAQLGEFHDAMTCLDKAIEINPQQADAWANKGILLFKYLGKPRESIECFERFIEFASPEDSSRINEFKGLIVRLKQNFKDS